MSRAINKTGLLVLAMAVAFSLAGCGKTSGTPGAGGPANPNDVAAIINGKEIKLSEIDTILNQQSKGQKEQLSPLELAASRLQILDELIKQEVLYQRAEKEGLLPKDDEILQVINEQKQQNGMTEEQYQKMLKDNNQTEQQLRDIAKKQIAVRKLLDKVGSTIGAPTEKEVEDLYSNNKQRYVNERGVALAAILVDPAVNEGVLDDAKGEAEAKQKIDIIYQRLKSGDFASIAREKSEDPQSSLRGGDLQRYFTEEQLKQLGLQQDLIAKFFGQMQNGDYTPPQRLGNGQWFIFKLIDKRLQTENLTLDNPDVRKDITDALINQRKQILIDALLRVAMNEAKIENKLAAFIVASPDKMSGLRPANPAPSASPSASAAAPPSPQATATPAASAPAKK